MSVQKGYSGCSDKCGVDKRVYVKCLYSYSYKGSDVPYKVLGVFSGTVDICSITRLLCSIICSISSKEAKYFFCDKNFGVNSSSSWENVVTGIIAPHLYHTQFARGT